MLARIRNVLLGINLPHAGSVLQGLVRLLQDLLVKPVVVRRPGCQSMAEGQGRDVHPIGYQYVPRNLCAKLTLLEPPPTPAAGGRED